jgi:hypothetical protein
MRDHVAGGCCCVRASWSPRNLGSASIAQRSGSSLSCPLRPDDTAVDGRRGNAARAYVAGIRGQRMGGASDDCACTIRCSQQ